MILGGRKGGRLRAFFVLVLCIKKNIKIKRFMESADENFRSTTHYFEKLKPLSIIYSLLE